MASFTGRRLLHWCGALCLVLIATLVHAQTLPAITFTLDFPGSQPEHYTIRVAEDGKASYESRGPLSSDSDVRDDFHIDFQTTGATRARIFELAAKAHHFSSDLDSHRKNLASTGNKTLSYINGDKQNSSTYNYSSVPVVQDLTRLFQDMASTLEFARRLDFYHRYQKLALDAELKRMEDLAKSSSLAELQAAEPILRQIADDPSVINVVRARARNLTERMTH